MYVWIWRHLPGGTAAKSAQTALLILAACALLLFVVFPQIEPWMPFSDVTINR